MKIQPGTRIIDGNGREYLVLQSNPAKREHYCIRVTPRPGYLSEGWVSEKQIKRFKIIPA